MHGLHATKDGSKHLVVLSTDTDVFIKGFSTMNDIEKQIALAEEYRVKFVRQSSTRKTIDQLRDFLYHHANCQYLPPTCYATRLHILRAFYATNLMTYVLSRTSKSLNPTLYGSEVVNDLLVLQFENDLIPAEVTITCNYSKCATQSPPCR